MAIAEQLEQKGMEKGVQLGRQEGFQLGRQEGLQLGRQEGRQEGFYQGKLEVAEKMLQKGFDRNTIIKMTGLTAQDLAGFEY